MRRCFTRALSLAIGMLLASALIWTAQSQNVWERLVTPGPLVDGHAKLEKDCLNCHEAFSRKSQSPLCLACHKEIALDRRLAKGFHGRQSDARTQECNHCHTDHKGRTADIVQLDRETFNHATTNFELKGAHKTVRCNGCHVQTIKFRDAPGRCFDCHKAGDPHKGRLGERCDDCHSEESWRRVKPFDHSKTKFPLVGAHSTVACSACHLGERYKDLSSVCVECHRIQDVHSGRYGGKCETCHDQNKWIGIHFNHDKTKFSLRFAHAKVKCDICHTGDLYSQKLATTCIGCHQKDDRHNGQLGRRCEQCHGEVSWHKITSFDHDITRFPLIGQHAVVSCEECHRSLSFRSTQRACAGCHQDQHHVGRLGTNCALCHNPNGWARWRFDHNTQTRYPLTGEHRGLSCQTCHVTKNVAKIALPMDCYSCHRQDDAHNGSFGRGCERCHTTSSFAQASARP